jgi:hypothetical protein
MGWGMSEAWNWLKDTFIAHQGLIYVVFFATACWGYSKYPRRIKVMVIGLWLMIITGVIVFVALAIAPDETGTFTAEELGTTLLGYSAALYALLCDWLRFGLARKLTRKSGPQWVKELDYPYLLLGAAGLFFSMTNLSVVVGHTARYEVLGPLLVATALVLRLIRTRADIENWAQL